MKYQKDLHYFGCAYAPSPASFYARDDPAEQLVAWEVQGVLEWVTLGKLLSDRNVRLSTHVDVASTEDPECWLMKLPREHVTEIFRLASSTGPSSPTLLPDSWMDWTQLLCWSSTCKEVLSIAIELAQSAKLEDLNLNCGGQDGSDISMSENHSLKTLDAGPDRLEEQRNARIKFVDLLRRRCEHVKVTTKIEDIFVHAYQTYSLYFHEESADMNGVRRDVFDHVRGYETWSARLERWLSLWLLKQRLRCVAAVLEVDVKGTWGRFDEHSNFEWRSRDRYVRLCGYPLACARPSEARFATVFARLRYDIDEDWRRHWQDEDRYDDSSGRDWSSDGDD